MRFIENGPDIPDELLIKRDDDRVVFFCGAGVSLAKAKLPDFYSLVEKIVKTLNLPEEHKINKILTADDIIDQIFKNDISTQDTKLGVKIKNLISADRIFGILEQEFHTEIIEEAVSKALHVEDDVDLSAHKTIINLSKTQDNRIQLVTTNFDRLFERCSNRIKSILPPQLPNPTIKEDMDGIIHLHGIINREGTCAEGNGYILSSSDFGNAYLAEGWATKFFLNIIEHYSVVFIGYSADDPPIHYLLEGLKKNGKVKNNIYSFQSGNKDEAMAKWQNKGVHVIPYSPRDSHSDLWNTLELWAKRARNPILWYNSIVKLAEKRPHTVKSFQRGQVAHVISTVLGARIFATSKNTPLAEWLCVFDPERRFAHSNYNGDLISEPNYKDAFLYYSLDSDTSPENLSTELERKIPENAWSAFDLNNFDYISLKKEYLQNYVNQNFNNSSLLLDRLKYISIWFQKIINEPVTIWWLLQKEVVPDFFIDKIKKYLNMTYLELEKDVYTAWDDYMNYHIQKELESYKDKYNIIEKILYNGWSHYTIIKITNLYKPYISMHRSIMFMGVIPPTKKGIKFKELISKEVKYPRIYDEIQIPDEWLLFFVIEFRKVIEFAITLEYEILDYPIIIRGTINESNSPFHCSNNLKSYVSNYLKLFRRLIVINKETALEEYHSWNIEDNNTFFRLKLLVSQNCDFISNREFLNTLMRVSNDGFWDSYNQKDLLLIIAKRWQLLSKQHKKKIEVRILKGRKRWKGEDKEKFKKYRSREILERLVWLSENGCDFSFNLESEVKKLKENRPDWKNKYAKHAVESYDSKGGFVSDNLSYSILEDVPNKDIISKCLKISNENKDFLINPAPFKGLSQKEPKKALEVLRSEITNNNNYPKWAWNDFFSEVARQEDSIEVTMMITTNLLTISLNPNFIFSLARWFRKKAKELLINDQNMYDNLFSKMIDVLMLNTDYNASSILRNESKIEWIMEAINSPVGCIVEVLLNDNRLKNIIPSNFFTNIEKLLSLKNEASRYAIVILTKSINWLFYTNKEWTNKNLLSKLISEDSLDKEAFISGILGNRIIPSLNMFYILKPYILDTKIQHIFSIHGDIEQLVNLIITGWCHSVEGSNEHPISDIDLKNYILESSNKNTVRLINHLQYNQRSNMNESWQNKLNNFFNYYWPKELKMKTSDISIALCNLAFKYSSGLIKIIIPLVSPILKEDLHGLIKPNTELLLKNHKDIVKLLNRVLPEDANYWTFWIEDLFLELEESYKDILKDKNYTELKRKWEYR